MSGFDRLSGALQYQIVNELGFRRLRPVQEQSIAAVLDGKNCVILAPTAGGKTEAAFFPLLSAMDEQDWKPVSVVYLSPIRALINNQEDRARRYASLIGRRVFKWHGDVGHRERKDFMANPADILLTTPESLEAMLMSARVPARELFSGLRAVIIDEIHAFAGDDRGAHLSALLERFARFCGRDLQRIGLSATVGNPEEILRWIRGSSERKGLIVNPESASSDAKIDLDHVGTMQNAALIIQRLHPGKKRLVFVNSRRQAEELGKLLREQDVDTFVSHGSLSLTERRDAEKAFAEGQDCVIVATSALELGIDVGDLNHVLQIDAPSSVASFLQRLGRTGRRKGAVANCTFLALKPSEVLQAAAIIRLFRQGYVEPVQPWSKAWHILAHQLMALSIQAGGIAQSDWWAWLDGAGAFADVSAADRAAIVKHMLGKEILSEQGGRYWLGQEGERTYGRANFRELYAVFDVPRLINVRWDTREIGTVDAKFLATLDEPEKPGTFTLAGRSWELLYVDWRRGACNVRPSPEGRAARWSGAGRFMSYELCQAIREILASDEEDPAWSTRARDAITAERADHAFVRDSGSPLLDQTTEIAWWTFAGGAANALLARMLEAELGEKVTANDFRIAMRDDAAQSAAAVRQAIRKFRNGDQPTPADALRWVGSAARQRVSKFEACLPTDLLEQLQARSGFDVEGARRAVEAF